MLSILWMVDLFFLNFFSLHGHRAFLVLISLQLSSVCVAFSWKKKREPVKREGVCACHYTRADMMSKEERTFLMLAWEREMGWERACVASVHVWKRLDVDRVEG